jgi:hypothetical protein
MRSGSGGGLSSGGTDGGGTIGSKGTDIWHSSSSFENAGNAGEFRGGRGPPSSVEVPSFHLQGIDMQLKDLCRAGDYAEPVS